MMRGEMFAVMTVLGFVVFALIVNEVEDALHAGPQPAPCAIEVHDG